jgi:hypothetical protein
MAIRENTFLLKRSNVPGKVPLPGDIQLGEVALNTADVKLYASGTTENDIVQIGWDRINRTGDTVTGDFVFNGGITATTISATTYLNYPTVGGVDELYELLDVLISGETGGDILQYNSTLSLWENSKPFWTIDLMDNSSVEFYTVQDVKINTITNIVGSPTITIADDGTPYTLTNTILSGSKITVTSNIQSVVKLNITY